MRMRTRTSHYSLDRYHYYLLGGAEEVQCKDRGAEVQTKYVQMFSRGDCAENVQGAEVVQMLMQRCRGAEVVQRCSGVGAEQGCRCRAGAEVQVCRVLCAEVQSICKGGSGEVIVQAIVQRRCRYGGAAVTDMQRCR